MSDTPASSSASQDESVEQLLPVSKALRLCGISVTPTTGWRWMRRGVRAADGSRVRLRHCRVGRRLYTKASWVQQFGERVAELDAVHHDSKNNGGAARRRPRSRNLPDEREVRSRLGLPEEGDQ